MAEPLKKSDKFPGNSSEVREHAASRPPAVPVETETHGMERQPEHPTLGKQIRARTNRPHKGDVGRPGTNEEVYQGSKTRR